ncbi:hypothetical protein AA0483_1707 [Acetobacter syzygii NRIC 0483]|nr:hypothetical protein AA0483_1707 [Acetobacter syzygii NRIC 0483]
MVPLLRPVVYVRVPETVGIIAAQVEAGVKYVSCRAGLCAHPLTTTMVAKSKGRPTNMHHFFAGMVSGWGEYRGAS